jgi:hypothetical protein
LYDGHAWSLGGVVFMAQSPSNEERRDAVLRRMLATPKPSKDQEKDGKARDEPKPAPAPKPRKDDERI